MSDEGRYSGNIYTDVGLIGGTFTNPDNGRDCECIGLEFPTGIGEETEVKFITLAAAKSLINDLKDGIEACMSHLNGEESNE